MELVAGATVSDEELMEYASNNIGEVGATPKHLEILTELPKTAVGKVFKPDLRKMAITRIFDQALSEKNAIARVSGIKDDKKLGLVAQISGEASDALIKEVLQDYTIPWQRS